MFRVVSGISHPQAGIFLGGEGTPSKKNDLSDGKNMKKPLSPKEKPTHWGHSSTIQRVIAVTTPGRPGGLH